MSIFLGFLTVLLVLNCAFLILLILIQLPKKDAGAGVAFGGAATDALFGAGTGTVLTKATKYAAGIFMGLALVLSVLNAHRARDTSSSYAAELQRRAAETTPTLPAAPPATNVPALPLPAPTFELTTTNLVPESTPPAATNAPDSPPPAP